MDSKNNMDYPIFRFYSDISFIGSTTSNSINLFPVIICPNDYFYYYDADNNICRSLPIVSQSNDYIFTFYTNSALSSGQLKISTNGITVGNYFIIQFWLKPIVSLSQDFDIVGQYGTNTLKIWNNSGTIKFQFGTTVYVSGSLSNNWNHYSFWRTDSTIQLYINSILANSYTSATNLDPIFINNSFLNFAFTTNTTTNVAVFNLKEFKIFNYKLSDELRKYNFMTSNYIFDMYPVIYLKFNDPNDQNTFTNYGDLTTQTNIGYSFLSYQLSTYKDSIINRLCLQYSLPLNPPNSVNTCQIINSIALNTSSTTSTTLPLTTSDTTIYNEFSIEFYIQFNYDMTSNTIGNFLSFRNFQFEQTTSFINVKYNSNSILSVANSTFGSTPWVYFCLRMWPLAYPNTQITFNINDNRISTILQSAYTCTSCTNTITLNLPNSNINIQLLLTYFRLWKYAISEAEMNDQRIILNFSKNKDYISYYDFRTFYLNTSPLTFYNNIYPTNTISLSSNMSIISNSKNCGQYCLATFVSNNLQLVTRSFLNFKNGNQLNLKYSTSLVINTFQEFSFDFWIKFPTCVFTNPAAGSKMTIMKNFGGYIIFYLELVFLLKHFKILLGFLSFQATM